MTEVRSIEDAAAAVVVIVRETDLSKGLASSRLKLQNAKATIENLENELAEMEDRGVVSFPELVTDRLVRPGVPG